MIFKCNKNICNKKKNKIDKVLFWIYIYITYI